MREERNKDTAVAGEYEDISQVPLEPGRPVGSSYVGGRPGRGGMSRRKPGAKGRAGEAGGGREPLGSRELPDSQTGERARRQAAGRTQERRHNRQEASGRSGMSGTASGRSGPRKGLSVLAVLLALALGMGAGLGGGYYLWGWERPYTVDLKAVEVPEWVEQDFIRKNIFSRPDVGRQRIDKIVIHYVANPGTTARNNRDYFDSLADQDPQKSGSSTSSHFIVGLEGEVIQCIPVSEIAYSNAPLNNNTVSIEVCHPDDTGKFNDVTYESVVKLTAWLCGQLKLSSRDVIRHYDVNGKICPKYFVDHEDAWKQFKEDVRAAIGE